MRKEGTSLNQILSGLGDLLEGLSGLAGHGADAIERVGTRSGRTSVTYGWSIGPASRSGADPDVDRDAAPSRPPSRAAVQEVFDEGEYIRTVVDVPGVVDGDIHFHVSGQELTIDARRHDGRRVIRVRIPAPVSLDGATSSYRNGMFEILLPKQRSNHGTR